MPEYILNGINSDLYGLIATSVYFIPCDPRKPYGIFITNIPVCLKERVPDEIWTRIITNLNAIIERHETASLWNILYFLIPESPKYFPSKFEKEVDEYIAKSNTELVNYGIILTSPTTTSFAELKVSIL